MLAVIYMYYSSSWNIETFVNLSDNNLTVKVEQPWIYKNVVAPVNATVPSISPPPVRNRGQEPISSDLPGQISSAPYQQIGRTDPRPYEDPTMKKTTRQRIAEIQERLKGFLAFKAQLLADRSDPQIQLPLSTAKADFERLKATLLVLSRNPSIQPSQTEEQMDEIDANLAYLLKEVERIETVTPGNFPAPLKPSIFEGFDTEADTDTANEFNNSDNSMITDELQNNSSQMSSDFDHSSELQSSSDMNNYSPEIVSSEKMNANADTKENSGRATLSDLNDFLDRVHQEKRRLSNTTTDPIINARIEGLNRIENDVRDIKRRIENKQMLESEIPITKKEIENALEQIQDGKTPNVIFSGAANNLPSQSIFTALSPSMPGILGKINSKLEDIGKNGNIRLGLNLQAELNIQSSGFQGLPGFSDSDNPNSNNVISNTVPQSHSISEPFEPSESPRPNLVNPVKNNEHVTELYENYPQSYIEGPTLSEIMNISENRCRRSCNCNKNCKAYSYKGGNTLNPRCTLKKNITKMRPDLTSESSKKINSFVQFPKRTVDWVYNRGEADILGEDSKFNWKKRSKEIITQIQKRGLDARQFGALENGAIVSPNFSWKGYTKMICNRLNTSYEAGLDVACGCPPMDWQGWQFPSRS